MCLSVVLYPSYLREICGTIWDENNFDRLRNPPSIAICVGCVTTIPGFQVVPAIVLCSNILVSLGFRA